MIFDKLENASNYFAIHPQFEKAFAFLTRQDLGALEETTFEIDGRSVYAMTSDRPGKKKEAAKLEAHRKYIDIQFLIEGNEQIGWKAYNDCKEVSSEFNAEKDFELFSDPAQTYFTLTPGTFAVFFPGDAHAPMVSDSIVHKVVIKVII